MSHKKRSLGAHELWQARTLSLIHTGDVEQLNPNDTLRRIVVQSLSSLIWVRLGGTERRRQGRGAYRPRVARMRQ